VPLRRIQIATLALFVLSACQSAPPSASPLEVTLVLLKTGPRAASSSADVMGGHLGNMQRLAREGHLLVAGPYGKRKTDPQLRGLFVFDTADRDRARQLAETDPGFQAGAFAFEYHTLTTTAPLRALLDLERAEQEAAARQGRKLAPGEGGRGYVLLTVENGDAAAAALAGHGAVLWFARLDGTRALVLLDALDRAAAQSMLGPLQQQLGATRLDEWFGSGHLAELPRLGRG
jgi:uncharacterized protein YciI